MSAVDPKRSGANALLLDTDLREGRGNETEHAIDAEPDRRAEDEQHRRHCEEEQLVRETPTENRLVDSQEEREEEQDSDDRDQDERQVADRAAFGTERFPMRSEHARHQKNDESINEDRPTDARRFPFRDEATPGIAEFSAAYRKQYERHRRNEQQRHHDRAHQRECLRERERFEELALRADHTEDR